MNVQRNLIQELMIYEFEPDHNAMEETKNICCAKDESAVNHRTVTRWLKKFYAGSKNLENYQGSWNSHR